MKNFGKLLTVLFAFVSVIVFLLCADTASLQSLLAKSIRSESSRIQAVPQATPRYLIYDIGVAQTGDNSSQGFGVSSGGVAVGRSIRTGAAQAFSWTRGGGIIGLPNLSGRAFCVSNAANDAGRVVGTCATTLFGSGKLPVVWGNGAATQLPLPAGETLGDANDINASGVAVGSVGGGSAQRGAIYNGTNATTITQTTANGSFFVTAFGVNDVGRVVGQGIDPTNAARNVGIVYDIGGSSAIEVGALPNANGALAFGVSNSGLVVGSSMLNQGSGLPFIWSQAGGITAIPLPIGTSSGSARAVNSAGWAVGTASSAFAIPFLYDGTATYRLADLIPAGTGWDLSTNTSSSALGISDTNVIVGTGILNGQVRAYAMVPAARPPYDFYGSGRTSFATIRVQNDNAFRWNILNNGGAGSQSVIFGANNSCSPTFASSADFDGDGKFDIAVFTCTQWFWIESATNTMRGLQFGSQDDIPVPADYTGDGFAEIAVFRAGVWYILNLVNNQVQAIQFGLGTDKPVTADYDGDGKTDIAVYRGGTWYWLRSSDNQARGVQFGAAGDKPITGDYDGDGRADQAVFRAGTWYLNRSTEGFYAVQFGAADDVPLVGDYNGDARADIAVYRPSTANFYWLERSDIHDFQFSAAGTAEQHCGCRSLTIKMIR